MSATGGWPAAWLMMKASAKAPLGELINILDTVKRSGVELPQIFVCFRRRAPTSAARAGRIGQSSYFCEGAGECAAGGRE
jgi:hypothetical protein